MKTMLRIICLILVLSCSTAFAQIKDLSGCEELTWKQHISKVPFKMKKVDSDKLVDGTKMDVYLKVDDPSLKKHIGAITSISYLFVNDRFAAVMYTTKDTYALLGMMKIISEKLDNPDKIAVEDTRIQAVWIRTKTIAYLDSDDSSVLVGDIDVMVLMMDKVDGVNI